MRDAFRQRIRLRFAIRAVALILSGSLTLVMAEPVRAQEILAKIGSVQTREAEPQRVFFGRVKARQTVDFAFQVGGQIVDLPIDEGQPIAAGTLIAQLDLEPFELALARAVTERNDARADFERFQQLSGSAVSQVTIDDAETQAELAEIGVLDAERSLRLATLNAPFDGIVARRMVPNFSTISAGTAVVRLHDMSDLRIEIEVPELVFQRVGENPEVSLKVEFPASPKLYDAEFREVAAETTQVGQSFQLTVGLEPPEDLFVLPGSSATVYAELLNQEVSLILPQAALVFDPDGAPSVMVFEPTGAATGTVTRTPVEIEPDPSGAVRVISGLSAGTEIVTAGAALLNDGDAVERFTGFTR
ncbi:MAG: efflux RND transporter periplasmic adaptor subunit [Pseudomonadota bacterium]